MSCISLVCTVHNEAGRANVEELHAILTHIGPEVIFLEVPPTAFADYYEIHTRQTLESTAVRRYRQSHQVELIPVDLPTPEREFFENHESLHMTIEQTSPEYRQLLDSHSVHVRTYGFAYLNSEYCSKLWFDFDQETLSAIRRIGESRLVEIHELWKETQDRREMKMIEMIQSYCGENTFDKGVLLVGSAHRQPIIDKARKHPLVGSVAIEWDFEGWLNR